MPPPLDPAEVHVWRVAVPESSEAVRGLAASLSADERARAARFVQPRDRARYSASHGALWLILGDYLHVTPERVAFVLGPRGKPALAPGLAASGLHFNLSHSGELALVAVTLRDVGVDIEQFRPLPDLDALAEQNFAPAERRVLDGLPAAERPAAFFHFWTGKEAFIKANGAGLSQPLAEFSVLWPPNDAVRPVQIYKRRELWGVRSLPIDAGYAAAVSAHGLDWRLVPRQFG